MTTEDALRAYAALEEITGRPLLLAVPHAMPQIDGLLCDAMARLVWRNTVRAWLADNGAEVRPKFADGGSFTGHYVAYIYLARWEMSLCIGPFGCIDEAQIAAANAAVGAV